MTCVEINERAVRRRFFTKSFLGDAAGWLVERRGTGIATPSSRRRVDGVEDDAAIQHERAVFLISSQASFLDDIDDPVAC